LCDTIPYNMVGIYWHFRCIYCYHI